MSMFGDPHIHSLASINSTDYQTCSELETFDNSVENPLIASELVPLIENDYYKIAGRLGRFNPDSNGTFIDQVTYM